MFPLGAGGDQTELKTRVLIVLIESSVYLALHLCLSDTFSGGWPIEGMGRRPTGSAPP